MAAASLLSDRAAIAEEPKEDQATFSSDKYPVPAIPSEYVPDGIPSHENSIVCAPAENVPTNPSVIKIIKNLFIGPIV